MLKGLNRFTVVVVSATLLIFSLIYLALDLLMPFILGGLAAYILSPLVVKLQKRLGYKRESIVLLTVLATFSLLIATLTIFLPHCYQQILSLYQIITSTDWNSITESTLESIYQHIPADKVAFVNAKMTELSQHIMNGLGNSLNYMIRSSGAVFSIIITIVLVPIIAYYLLCDYRHIGGYFGKLLDRQGNKKIAAWLKETDSVLRSFLAGQITISLFWGLYYGIIYWLLGIKFAVALGLIAFVTSFLPYVGAVISLIISLIVIMIQFGDITTELWLAVLFYVIGHVADVAFLSNYLVGKKIGLHPLVTIFSLLFSAKFFGILGMFAALPMAAIIKVIFEGTVVHHRAVRAKAKQATTASSPNSSAYAAASASPAATRLPLEKIKAGSSLPRSAHRKV